jgi:nickel/cobalt exporter
MRRAVMFLALGLVALAGLYWAMGGLDQLAQSAQEAQRGFQAQLAQGLRSLRAGEPGALIALWGLSFAYGFVHAAGPGHGKFLLGAYGAGTQVPLRRMMGLGLAASLAQGVTAVALVYGGVLIFNATREGLQLAGDLWLERASLIAIALIGLWLVMRATRKVLRQSAAPPVALAGHDPSHDHGACDSCGHRHGPSAKEMAQITGWRDAALLIGAIAIRPCTGALFVLILTWRMGLVWEGIAAALIMALGTASVTIAVAATAVLAREGAMDWADRLGRARHLGPVVEGLAGLFILAVAVNMLKIL